MGMLGTWLQNMGQCGQMNISRWCGTLPLPGSISTVSSHALQCETYHACLTGNYQRALQRMVHTVAGDVHGIRSHWNRNRQNSVRSLAYAVAAADGSAQKPKSEKNVERKAVVVVESPVKAKTIEKYLGDGFVVLASYGHVRDLASKSGSVRPAQDFQLLWEVPPSAQQHLDSIKSALGMANTLFLASDPDREGEAIAWHVLEMLKMDGALKSDQVVKRVVFHEITKTAVVRAMESPREISVDLVDAYLARRALDYLIGFQLSPVLWRKLPGSRSAGRVQSVALRMICERETEIESFNSQEYWTVEAQVLSSKSPMEQDNAGYRARLTHYMGAKLGQFSLIAETAATAAKTIAESKLSAASVKKSMSKRNPPAPYITSTLQQDASNKLSFSATRTMAVAQQLYEGVSLGQDELTGLITYMRTDCVQSKASMITSLLTAQLSEEAVQSIRSLIAERYGSDYVPNKPPVHQSKAKNAQEAHEAIRPTDIFRLPSSLVHALDEDALRLYSLIWCRAVACQMEPAVFEQVAVQIVNDDKSVELCCNGSVPSFLGFRLVYNDKDALAAVKDWTCLQGDESEGEVLLPPFQAGDEVIAAGVEPIKHHTEPPPRYSEASLVKKMEELGIGRPSTYASTLKTLQARTYVRIVKRRIFPETRGQLVSHYLGKYFEQYVDCFFTAKMESELDEISAGRRKWKSFLGTFWPPFHSAVTEAMKVPIEQVAAMLEKDFLHLSPGDSVCPRCQKGKMSLKLSRYGHGYFMGCSEFPNCLYKAHVLKYDEDESDEEETTPQVSEGLSLGTDPDSGLEVILKVGPFGKYVQLGTGSKTTKPKRHTVPPNRTPVTLEAALQLLSYPIELGKHPKGGLVTINVTQRGEHIVRHKGCTAVIPKDVPESEISLVKALEWIANSAARPRSGRPSLRAQKAKAEHNTSRRDLTLDPTVRRRGKVAVKDSLPVVEKVDETEEQSKLTNSGASKADTTDKADLDEKTGRTARSSKSASKPKEAAASDEKPSSTSRSSKGLSEPKEGKALDAASDEKPRRTAGSSKSKSESKEGKAVEAVSDEKPRRPVRSSKSASKPKEEKALEAVSDEKPRRTVRSSKSPSKPNERRAPEAASDAKPSPKPTTAEPKPSGSRPTVEEKKGEAIQQLPEKPFTVASSVPDGKEAALHEPSPRRPRGRPRLVSLEA